VPITGNEAGNMKREGRKARKKEMRWEGREEGRKEGSHIERKDGTKTSSC
jgi:hypothetical protein